jgi:hypothetical protein
MGLYERELRRSITTDEADANLRLIKIATKWIVGGGAVLVTAVLAVLVAIVTKLI